MVMLLMLLSAVVIAAVISRRGLGVLCNIFCFYALCLDVRALFYRPLAIYLSMDPHQLDLHSVPWHA